ncbi:MAG TPA: carboxypeptidase-like regulatory domain-containing protein [Vicinamibacterales bacterium]|nr:carboxypeptidase-like regulatory domain-containing protein [Vicinamibacterales bacterium]
MASLLLLPGIASAQSVNAGSIAGTVRDTTGAVMPGVTVEASSPALIEKTRSGVTDTQGNYKIVDLRPGIYTVTFTLPGFSTVKRESLELTTGFTANVSAEMRVGALEETVTVTSATPVVDIQNVRQQIVLSKDVWEALPTGKTVQAYASLTPGALLGASSQDVGGSHGDTAGSSSFTFHGTSSNDSQVVIEGMNFQAQTTGSGPWTRTTHENQFAFQETTLASSLSAEIENAGVFINHVPRDGGNRFAGTFGVNGSASSFQGSNLTSELVARGVQAPGSLKKLYDVGGGFGGPLKQDKVWFFFSDRTWNAENYIVNSFYNATPAPAYGLIPIYTPDLSRQAASGTPHHDDDLRVTVQATSKQKVSFFTELQGACTCAYGVGATRSPEAGEDLSSPYLTHNFAQGTWTWVKSNRLLIEAGDTYYWQTGGAGGTVRAAGVSSSAIPVYDISTNFSWNAFGQDPIAFGGVCCSPFTSYNQVLGYSRTNDMRFSVTLGGASQTLKVGARVQPTYMLSGDAQYNVTPYGAVSLGFLGGTNGVVPVPKQIYELLNPQGPAPGQPNDGAGLVMLSALYAQDQWVVRRMTLNAGLRFDGMYGRYHTLTTIANDYVGPQTIPGVTSSPSWKDINPRVGVAIDLFGNGKSALKGSVGRYVTHASDPLNNPAGQLGFGGGIRTWNDTNHNYVPDCDLTNPLTNGECGALPNTSRGLAKVPTQFYDPGYLAGWDVRPYYWNSSVSLQQELRPGVGLNVGYFNTWNGNLTVTANRAQPASVFNSYCVPAPTDSRLGAVSGQPVCGLFDVNPSNFGQVNNLITQASNYGKWTNIYNGVDATVSARFGKGGTLQGGFSTSKLSVNNCSVAAQIPQVLVSGSTNTPAGYCSYTVPWSAQTQLKLFGAYPLRWGLQVSGTFQNLAGPQVTASHTFTNAQIFPSLGRNLSSGANGTVSVALLPPYSQFEPRFNQVDLRLTKAVVLGRARALLAIDGYNLFNSAAVLATNGTYAGTTGGSWLTPTAILGARLMKLGLQLDWK